MFVGEGSDRGTGARDGGVNRLGSGGPGTAGSAALVEAARLVAGVGLSGRSDREVLGVLDDLERVRRVIDAVTVEGAGQLDVSDATVVMLGHRTAPALAQRYGWPAAKAKDMVRTGRMLRYLSRVEAALRAGTINVDQAGVICRAANPRNADVIAGAQDELVALADGVRFERFAADVRALADLADGDGGHDPRPDRNTLSMSSGSGGELYLKGTFVGEFAARVRGALDQVSTEMWRRHRRDQKQSPELGLPGRPQICAEALAELVRRGLAADTTTTRAPVTDVTLVLHAVETAEPGFHWEPLGSRVGRCTDVAGIRIGDRTVQLLACDPTVHTLITDSLGVPLDLGRTVRFADAAQRRAAAVRDGGCVFPGCDAPPSWCDLHHVHHARDGGPTSLDNLASLCRHHHGIVHRRGWRMRPADEQWFEFTTPAGRTLHSQRHGRPRHPD